VQQVRQLHLVEPLSQCYVGDLFYFIYFLPISLHFFLEEESSWGLHFILELSPPLQESVPLSKFDIFYLRLLVVLAFNLRVALNMEEKIQHFDLSDLPLISLLFLRYIKK
jgi:hypothetical protein